jgi:hypothetical protein
MPSILPVNYALLDDDVVFRTDPGSKLLAALMKVLFAFEVDDADPRTRTGWASTGRSERPARLSGVSITPGRSMPKSWWCSP